MKVLIERNLSTAECGDIAITAAEGGIGYWSQIQSYHWERWSDDETSNGIEVPEDFVFYTIEYEGYAGPMTSEEALHRADITPLLIRRGVQLFLTGTLRDNQFEGRQFDDMDDLACMDSAEADCVIQLGVFGELVYG